MPDTTKIDVKSKKSFINLSKEELSKEKHLGLGIYNKLDLVTLCKKFSSDNKNIKVYIIDIFY